MASAVTETAAHLQRNFARGHKKLYLPNHVVTFIRPKPEQSANLATFVVPLQFTKLDLRDYLWHAYNVKVLSVRSFVNQQPLERKGFLGRGAAYRPRSQKMMMVELEKPFVWPEPLSGTDLQDFDNYLWKQLQKLDDEQVKAQQDKQNAAIKPRLKNVAAPARRSALGKEVDALLHRGEVWTNKAKLDERWAEVGKTETKSK